ncbi:hypothetical protein GCM10008025_35830 [Ornithinibacillus halotolerans]|uniref:Uncharacterized protein n=2 Tax=Ornithinibacillus halotolerans TaxID=1274357 RepID=A0A916SAW0_9BACI|nr:hypothetical protein GCM10008025_35830 [Ornithinibacillus halotolerans]
MENQENGEKNTSQNDEDQQNNEPNEEEDNSEDDNTEVEDQAGTNDTDGIGGDYPSCEGIIFEAGKEIDGSTLADCVVEAMISQQSGSHIVRDDTGFSSTVDFKWDPNFSLSLHSNEFSVVLKEDTGWVNTGTGWIQADSNSTEPEVMMATSLIDLYRVFSDPRFIAEYLGAVPTWTVVGEESTPDSEAFVDIAWKLTSDDVVDMGLSVLTDWEYWITSDYLGAYFAATGTSGDFTVRTSNTFIQWGGEVEIPDPE